MEFTFDTPETRYDPQERRRILPAGLYRLIADFAALSKREFPHAATKKRRSPRFQFPSVQDVAVMFVCSSSTVSLLCVPGGCDVQDGFIKAKVSLKNPKTPKAEVRLTDGENKVWHTPPQALRYVCLTCEVLVDRPPRFRFRNGWVPTERRVCPG